MKTVWKMLAVEFASIGLVVWYLSYQPQPWSDSNMWLLVLSAPISVWVSFLVWKIDGLQEDVAQFKTEATDYKDFAGIFVHPSRVREVLASMAGRLHGSFGVVEHLQGKEDTPPEELEMVLQTAERDKVFFWKAVDLGHRLMGTQPKKSYKDYLPKEVPPSHVFTTHHG
jgi:hypothetical protein